MSTYSTSSDDDVDREVIALGNRIGERKIATLLIGDVIGRQLLLPLRLSVRVCVVVVLRGNDDASLLVGKVRDNVAPSEIVVDTQSDDEIFTGVGQETKGATCPAAAHSEHIGTVNFAPCPPVSELPNCPLDEVEEGICIDLVDPSGDCVGHSVGKKWMTSASVVHRVQS